MCVCVNLYTWITSFAVQYRIGTWKPSLFSPETMEINSDFLI